MYFETDDTVNLVFKDTLFNLVFDAINHDLGSIIPENKNNEVIKYFKYLGTDSLFITKAWTGDPHYICYYPKELLIPNKIYYFKVCFANEGRQGKLNKKMGFNFSNGNTITFKFTGTYLP
jgi:hypothetical protein